MNKSTQNPLALLQSAWEQCPRGLFSLWDMIQVVFGDLDDVLADLERLRATAVKSVQDHGDTEVPKATKDLLIQRLDQLKNFCDKMQMSETDVCIVNLYCRCTGLVSFDHMTQAAVASGIESLQKAFWHESGKRKCAFVPPAGEEFCERDDLFGDEVKTRASAELSAEIKHAGNCLSVDLNTAAVFHLMRAVELVMRSFALHLGLVTVKRKPVESAGWDDIIKAIRDVLAVRRKKYDGRRRKKRSELDAIRADDAAADELNVFKEIWRNNVMHTRHSYDTTEAQAVFSRVRGFVQRMSKRVPLK